MIAIAGKGDTTSAQAIAKNNTGVMIFAGGEDDTEINDSSKANIKHLSKTVRRMLNIKKFTVKVIIF